MIVLTDRHLAIVIPPKVASTSMHYRFCHDGNGIYVMGPQIDGAIEKHTTELPFLVRTDDRYRVILMVRNPFTRARSLWLHYRSFCGELNFKNWVKIVLITSSDPFNTSISQIVKNLKVDMYVKLEYVNKTFKKEFDIDLDLPVMHKKNDDSEIDIDEETENLITYWGYQDFSNYRYSDQVQDA